MAFALNTPVSQNGKNEPAPTLKITFPSRVLRERFKAACALNGKNMSEAIIEFVQRYVEENEAPLPKKGKGN